MRPVIVDQGPHTDSGVVETEEAEIICDEGANSEESSTEVLAQIEVKSADTNENNDE